MRNLSKTFKILLIVTGLLALSACGNKKSSSRNSSGNNVVGGNCNNCGGIQQPGLLTNFVSESGHPTSFPIALVNGQMFGSLNGVQSPAETAYNVYVGSVSMQATLRVTQKIGDQYAISTGGAQGCVINPGDYALTTLQLGQMSYGSNLTMPSLAAGNIRLQLVQGMMWKENNVVRVKGVLNIVSVGGRNCGAFYTDIL